MKKALIVAKREYLRMVRSKGFWISTLMIPFLMVVISLVSGLSGKSLDEKLTEAANNADSIYVLDESGYVNKDVLAKAPGVTIPASFDAGVAAVKDGSADLFIYYPADLLESKKIDIITQDNGIFSVGMFDALAANLIKQNILSEIGDANKIALVNTTFSVDTRLFNKGEEVSAGYDRYILPVASVVAYFLFASIASSYLLLSVSEEKENRMIEIVLSVIKPRDLIVGKVVGLLGAIMTQLIILVGLAVLILSQSGFKLPFDIGTITIDPGQLVLAIIYLVLGLLILAFTMVGVGAAMPTYKEANSFSAVFIMLSIFPIYLFALILAEPKGLVALILSYFPYSGPLVLLLRNALGALPVYEIIISIVALIVEVIIIAVIAYKMFEFGAMEYTEKVSLKNFFRTKFKEKK